MIRVFFKTAFRNILKTKGYSFLNIFGLAVGIACAGFIFLWIEDEVSYDNHFPNREDIYSVRTRQVFDGSTNVHPITSGALVPAIKSEIPGVRYAARINWYQDLLFSVNGKDIYQKGTYADPEIMDIFSLEFIEGSRENALAGIHDILLNQTAAKRLFGTEKALGKPVRIDNDETYIVSGVVKDLPKTSTYNFDWLISFKNYARDKDWVESWGNYSFNSLVQLDKNADFGTVNTALTDLEKRKSGNSNSNAEHFLYPLERWHLYDSFDRNGNEQGGVIRYVRLFSSIAWVVLIIACVNFMNLSTARSEKRAKEVSIHKVVGAGKVNLIVKFLGESVILAILSSLVAVAFMYLFITPFNHLVEKELTISIFKTQHLLFLIIVTAICGFISGCYPAFYLSSFNPVQTLKGGKQKTGSTGYVRRGLVVLQYSACIILLISTAIIYQQIQHARNRDMGFDRSQIMTIPLKGDMYTKTTFIKEQLLATGQVDHVGISNMSILQIGSTTWGISWDGKEEGKYTPISILQTDADFLPAMGLQLTDGRNFHANMLGDSSSVVVNETFAKMIRQDGMVAGKVIYWGKPYTIAGVVKDFVHNNVYAPAKPVILAPKRQNPFGMLNVRTKGGVNLSETIANIERVIKASNPQYPFEYHFLDETFDNFFKSEMLIQKLAAVFAVLSIIISCLGLFGLASYSAEQRAKEIGIRKVLGASVSRLVGLLNREFIILVGVSCLFAFPIAWWIMHGWLDSFDYRIEIGWIVFVWTAVIAFGIALLAISSQALRTATANPVKTLKES